MTTECEAYDVFGNKHEPDNTGYCPCWQCPKQFGEYPFNTWWQPNLKLQSNSRLKAGAYDD